MDLLTGFRASVPEAPVSPQAEARFQTLIAQRRSRLHRSPALSRRVRLVLLAPVAAGAAAAVALALLPASGQAPAPALTVKLLADQAAAAALRQPSVSPGQWVYRELEYKMSRSLRRPPTSDTGTMDIWETADGVQGDYTQPLPPLLFGYSLPGLIPYADLGSLPSDPAALDRYLAAHQPFMSWATPSMKAFDAIEGILAQYVVPPRPTAELYRALADIPGVTVNAHTRDIAGQRAVAFTLSGAGLSEIILNPTTDTFMGVGGKFGEAKASTKGHPLHVTWVYYEVVIIRQAFVSGNGVLP